MCPTLVSASIPTHVAATVPMPTPAPQLQTPPRTQSPASKPVLTPGLQLQPLTCPQLLPIRHTNPLPLAHPQTLLIHSRTCSYSLHTNGQFHLPSTKKLTLLAFSKHTIVRLVKV